MCCLSRLLFAVDNNEGRNSFYEIVHRGKAIISKIRSSYSKIIHFYLMPQSISNRGVFVINPGSKYRANRFSSFRLNWAIKKKKKKQFLILQNLSIHVPFPKYFVSFFCALLCQYLHSCKGNFTTDVERQSCRNFSVFDGVCSTHMLFIYEY